MVNNQKIYIKKEGSLVRRKNTFAKKKKNKPSLNQVLLGCSGHRSTQRVNRFLPDFCSS